MGTLKLHPTPTPAPHWWHSLAAILGFSRRQSRDFWHALSTSKDERLAALVYRCHQHEAYLRTQRLDLLTDGRMLNDFLRTTWTVHTMVTALEVLFREGRVSRKDATVYQERFMRRADFSGRWAMPH